MTGTSTTVHVGVIGVGGMGAAHVRTLSRRVPSAVVVAAYDPDIDRATAVCAEVDGRVAASAADIISAADVDAVLIAAPDPLHADLVLACLDAGKPTLCEKPLATTTDGSQRIVEAEVALGRQLIQVGFMRRFDTAFVELRSLVATGALGAPRVVHCVHRNAEAHPTATSEGIVVNSMIHELDHLPWLLDDPLATIEVVTPRADEGRLRDPLVALIETTGGVLATIEVFVNARYGYDVQCEVVGTSGTARLTPPYGLVLRRDGMDGARVSEDFVTRFADAYRGQLAAWVEAAGQGQVAGPSAWDGHRANVAAAAGVESLHSGRRVAISVPAAIPALYR
jgi:myo-inositol 2-dehydrogenase/D-chiro-inositol 1-dehydrogenase